MSMAETSSNINRLLLIFGYIRDTVTKSNEPLEINIINVIFQYYKVIDIKNYILVHIDEFIETVHIDNLKYQYLWKSVLYGPYDQKQITLTFGNIKNIINNKILDWTQKSEAMRITCLKTIHSNKTEQQIAEKVKILIRIIIDQMVEINESIFDIHNEPLIGEMFLFIIIMSKLKPFCLKGVVGRIMKTCWELLDSTTTLIALYAYNCLKFIFKHVADSPDNKYLRTLIQGTRLMDFINVRRCCYECIYVMILMYNDRNQKMTEDFSKRIKMLILDGIKSNDDNKETKKGSFLCLNALGVISSKKTENIIKSLSANEVREYKLFCEGKNVSLGRGEQTRGYPNDILIQIAANFRRKQSTIKKSKQQKITSSTKWTGDDEKDDVVIHDIPRRKKKKKSKIHKKKRTKSVGNINSERFLPEIYPNDNKIGIKSSKLAANVNNKVKLINDKYQKLRAEYDQQSITTQQQGFKITSLKTALSTVEQQSDHYKYQWEETKIANENLQIMLRESREREKLLTIQVDLLMTERDELQTECKEMTIKYNALKEKYDKQRKKKNYTEWDCNDVVEWICSLDNGRYNKYETKISMTMKEENITGNVLMYLDKNDLHRLGVTDFADKKRIINHIQNLNNATNELNDIEGVDATILM